MNIWADVNARVAKQDAHHPSGYPATRDGIRLGIAAAEDELRETRDAWRGDRCKCPTPLCDHATWENVRDEALDVIAVLFRMVRSIERPPAEPTEGEPG